MDYPKVRLAEIEWPEIGTPAGLPVPEPTVAELEERLGRCRRLMAASGLTHLVIYGDREHFANLMYLTHFDPRFEEALLIICLEGTPLILVGNECEGHLNASPLHREGKLRHELFQSFSLMGQPRDKSRPLEAVFQDERINKGSKVGCAGWKYFTGIEFDHPEQVIEIPSFIADILRSICGYTNVLNSNDLLMSPRYGLRSRCSVHEIAFFEYSNMMGSEGMKNLLKNFRADVPDFELLQEYRYTGYPLSCHIGMKSSGNQHVSLSSAMGTLVKRGEPCSTSIAYWGSNICRAGWVAESETDLPEQARNYVPEFAAPYFHACAIWYENLKLGTEGKILQGMIDACLPFSDFGVYLNPGHLSHYDEWMHSPIYRNSADEICSGMYIQVDIIPRSSRYGSCRMEEGVIIADHMLQKRLKEQYPEVYARCMKRRDFMITELGFDLPDEVLPLSNMPAIVPPFFLNYRKMLTLK
jgi:hypothetical protein